MPAEDAVGGKQVDAVGDAHDARHGGSGGDDADPSRRAARLQLDRDETGANAFGQDHVDLRDAVGCRVADVDEAAGMAVGGDAEVC